MRNWIDDYIVKQQQALESINTLKVEQAIAMVNQTRASGGRIFIAGNGGSMCNATHFHVDLMKGANAVLADSWGNITPDCYGFYFDCTAFDGGPMLSALGNDIDFQSGFSNQAAYDHLLEGGLVICVSVSGTSPNIRALLRMANRSGAKTILLSRRNNDASRGDDFDIDLHIEIDDTHYGRVEDAQMTILHMICYAFMEKPEEACGL